LKSLSEKGQAASASLAHAMEKIKEASALTGPVIDAVDDLTEKVNLLAMNASIEAAHAGTAGRGFAVIAQEIKKLAAASAQRSGMIRDSIREIEERVAQGVHESAGVLEGLAGIARGSETALEDIDRIHSSISEQRESGGRALAAMEALKKASGSIRSEAGSQVGEGRTIRGSMDELSGKGKSMVQAISGISEMNSELLEAIKDLARTSREGSSLIEDLRSLIGKKS
jgi:methyl-accepting chemotaxis protein